jgi:hypothetical protein
MPYPHATVITYTDPAGARHAVAVDVDRGGAFRVLDVGPARTLLVERLAGYDDDPDRALACARDYAAQVAEYQAGARDALPLPPPLGRHPVTVLDGARPRRDGSGSAPRLVGEHAPLPPAA